MSVVGLLTVLSMFIETDSSIRVGAQENATVCKQKSSVDSINYGIIKAIAITNNGRSPKSYCLKNKMNHRQ